MKSMKTLFSVALFALLVAASIAQPGGGRGMRMFGGGYNPSMLLQQDDVQKELKLTDDQKGKLAELRDKQREEMMAAMQEAQGDREAMGKIFAKAQEKVAKELKTILSDTQSKRLKELALQKAGALALTNAEIQKDLDLTKEQISKVAELQKKQQEAMQAVMEKMRNGEIDREQIRPLMEKNSNIMKDELTKILTEAQKTKMKELSGAPFKFDETEG